jgi:hypothetical protein
VLTCLACTANSRPEALSENVKVSGYNDDDNQALYRNKKTSGYDWFLGNKFTYPSMLHLLRVYPVSEAFFVIHDKTSSQQEIAAE